MHPSQQGFACGFNRNENSPIKFKNQYASCGSSHSDGNRMKGLEKILSQGSRESPKTHRPS